MLKGIVTKWWQADLPIVIAIEGFTGESPMLTNPCHRPQVDSATCSSYCSLFSSSSSPPHPFSYLFHSSSPICSLLLTLSLSLSLSSSPICPPLSLFFATDISTLLLFCLLSLSVCLCSSEREVLLLFLYAISIAC